jgi:hypothetical protein
MESISTNSFDGIQASYYNVYISLEEKLTDYLGLADMSPSKCTLDKGLRYCVLIGEQKKPEAVDSSNLPIRVSPYQTLSHFK